MNHRNAISYARFSSGSQAKGSSIVRQRDAFKAWLERNPQFVPSAYSRMDEGVSGYTSANLGEGKGLHSIIQLIQEKKIVAGDALVVEAIDRLGRADFLTMVDVIGRILTAGVSIITLEDEQEYTEASVNTGAVFNLVVKIQAAHEYSNRLGIRVSAAYDRKRADARQGKTVKVSRPFWLKSGGAIDSEAGAIVRLAIEMYLNGKGTRHIAKHISPMHERLKNLNPSTLKRWFSSRALIGEWKNKGDAIGKVFERLLEDSEFYKLQAELKRRAKTQGPADKYILSGMVFCERCGAKFQTRRQYPKPTLAAPLGSQEYKDKPVILYSNCKAYLQKGSCNNSATWPYEVLEFIYRRAASGALSDVAEGIAMDSRSDELDALVASIALAEEYSETQENLYQASKKPKYLDEVAKSRKEIEELQAKADQLRLSISRQVAMDAVDVVQTFEENENFNVSHAQQVQSALDELSARPADEIANILKRYLRIKIDGKKAYSPYDQQSYLLIRRSQKHACYFLESSHPDDTVEDRTAEPIYMYHAVTKGARSIQSARSLAELEEKLA
ncbi:recombinase family protein [Acidovorax sp. Root568]|uniref:recombinase family protein n=1 Tax=Acidovorax sp. Root568 TaxID=1736565 RepID=UPI0009E96368|nr:recombinase family protein [Acidovorax sp. Root568]